MSVEHHGIESLLAQCDREDRNEPDRRFLYTSEIRALLFGWATADYSGLSDAIRNNEGDK